MTAVFLLSIALAPLTAFACFGFARSMRNRGIGQQIRELGPRGHATKAGTPTTGGLLVLSGWAIAVLSLGPTAGWARPIAFVLAAGVVHGAIGLLDDFRSLRRLRSLGLSAGWKILLGSAAAVALFFAFPDVVSVSQRIPFSSIVLTLPPVATFALVWIGLLATTNSLNLADGLDGLAGGLAVLILIGLLALSPSRANLTATLPLIGALLGFLWMNAHPAQIFLGDVGSFGVGAIVAALALANGTAFFLPLVAGVLVLEAGSVILQVSVYRIAKVRLFKMSPLHHHFERSSRTDVHPLIPAFEWPETQVTVRFLLVESLFVGLALWAAGAL